MKSNNSFAKTKYLAEINVIQMCEVDLETIGLPGIFVYRRVCHGGPIIASSAAEASWQAAEALRTRECGRGPEHGPKDPVWWEDRMRRRIEG
nr:hypothetical protein Iba_chr08aCG3970 [Ipomoea batatas]